MISKVAKNYIRELYINIKSFFIFFICLFFYLFVYIKYPDSLDINRDLIFTYLIYASVYFKNIIEVNNSLNIKKIVHLLYTNEYY